MLAPAGPCRGVPVGSRARAGPADHPAQWASGEPLNGLDLAKLGRWLRWHPNDHAPVDAVQSTMTLNYESVPNGNGATNDHDTTETKVSGVAVRRPTSHVATRLRRYRVPTIRRNTDVEAGFAGFTPDGPEASESAEHLARGRRNWGSGIWPLPRPRRAAQTRGEGGKQVLTLYVGAVHDEEAEPTERYLRKRDYGVSRLPVFLDAPDETATTGSPARDGRPGTSRPHDDQESGRADLLSPGQPQQRDYDEIRLALYSEAMSAWRQLTDVRFRLMGLLPAISIVAFVPLLLVVARGNPFLALTGLALALLGLGVTHGLHIYQERNDEIYGDLISRARRIEAELGVDTGIMLGRLAPQRPWVSHGRGTQWVYRCVKLAWLTVATVLATATVVFALDWLGVTGARVEASEVDVEGSVTLTPRE